MAGVGGSQASTPQDSESSSGGAGLSYIRSSSQNPSLSKHTSDSLTSSGSKSFHYNLQAPPPVVTFKKPDVASMHKPLPAVAASSPMKPAPMPVPQMGGLASPPVPPGGNVYMNYMM